MKKKTVTQTLDQRVAQANVQAANALSAFEDAALALDAAADLAEALQAEAESNIALLEDTADRASFTAKSSRDKAARIRDLFA